MQRFVEADYYELDWYYEECADGKTSGNTCFLLRLSGGGEIFRTIKHFLKVS